MDRQLQLVLKLQNEATNELKNISKQLGGVGKETEKTSSSFSGFAKNILAAAGAYVSFSTAYKSLRLGVSIAADMQTAKIGLQTLLGSSEDAEKTIARLKIEAARTPFELRGLTQAAQLLTSVTKNGNKSIDIILDIGEGLAAMGKGQAELDRIIVNLQQIAAVGRASSIDIKQFAFAGIPIFEMLQEQTGLAGEALDKFITNGGVTFDLLTDMFDKANDEGGKFFNAFKNQQGSFNQSLANMQDTIGIALADIAERSGLLDFLTEAMQRVSEWITDNKDKIINLIQTALPKFVEGIKEMIHWLDENKWILYLVRDAFILLGAQMLAQKTILLGQGVIGAFGALANSLTAAGTQVKFLSTQFALLPVAVTIGVALIGYELIQEQLRKLKESLNEFSDSAKHAEDLNQRAIDKARELKASGEIEKAQRLLNTVQNQTNISTASNVSSSFFKNLVDGIGGLFRANGGPVTAGSPYIVGERGPEWFIPRSSGTVLPNGTDMGGGVTVIVNGDVSGNELVERVKEALMQQLSMNMRIS